MASTAPRAFVYRHRPHSRDATDSRNAPVFPDAPDPPNLPDPPATGAVSPEDRQHMIAEAAYYRYLKRGAAPGHELDDWLAAEEDYEGAKHRRQGPEQVMRFGMPGGMFGTFDQEALRRVTRQHPRRETPGEPDKK